MLILVFVDVDDRYKTGILPMEFIEDICTRFGPMREYLSNRTISFGEIVKSKDPFKEIVDKPFVIFDGCYVIGDYALLLECILQGPIFKIENDTNLWLTYYGKIMEEYVNELFARIYPHSIIFENRYISNYQYFIGKNRYEIDGIITDIKSVVFMEIKNVLIRKSNINTDKPKLYLESIDQKYGVTDKNGIKGIGQIKRIIDNYIDGRINTIQKLEFIYSILVVNDSLITAPIVYKYLNERYFAKFEHGEMLDNGLLLYREHTIYPLLIINVRELELMERTISEKGLINIMNGFFEYNKTGNESLRNYMHDKNIGIYTNSYLAKIGYDTIISMGTEIFPEIIAQIRKEKNL